MIKRSVKLLLNRTRTPDPFSVPWSWGLALFLCAAYLLLFFAALVFTSTLADADFDTPEPRILAWSGLLSGILLVVMIIQNTTRTRQNNHNQDALWDILFLNPTRNTPLWGVLFMAFIVATATDLIGVLLGSPENTHPMPLYDLDIENTGNFLLALLVVVVVRPVAEGLLFYGVVYPALSKVLSPLQTIALTALVFAGLRYALDTQFFWWGFVYPLMIGLVAGFARAATKSNQTTIGVHMMFGVFVILRAIALA